MEIGSIIEFTLLTLIATLAIDFIGRGIVSIVLWGALYEDRNKRL